MEEPGGGVAPVLRRAALRPDGSLDAGADRGGAAFLAVIIVAYFVFPRTRLNIIKIVVGLSLALLVAYLIADISLGHK